MKKAAIEVATVIEFENVVLGRADSHYISLQILHGKLIGRMRGAKYSKDFDLDVAIKKYEVTSYMQLVMMLMLKRLDGIVGLKEGF